MGDETGVYLHAGAHRTGTSSFQACLAANAGVLGAAGYDLAYPGRDGIPTGTLALRLPHPRHGRKSFDGFRTGAVAELARHVTGPGRALVVSEENVPGRMFHFYQGQFFPAARRRARILKEALPGPLRHLLYVVRPYDALYVSAFRKRSEDNPTPPFAEVRERMMQIDTGWPELLEVFAEELQPDRMTVIEYGARGSSTDLLRRLLPDTPEVEEPEAQLNLSATDAALMALQARYHAGETLERAAWQAVIADHAADRTPRDFAAFTEAQRQTLGAAYARDLDRIAAMPGLTFIR